MKADERARLDQVLEAARDVDVEDPSARERFILGAIQSDLWVIGKTAEPLAKVWGLSRHTVDRDASRAARAMRTPESREELGKVAVRTTVSMVEGRAQLSDDLASRLREELQLKAKPSTIRDLATALSALDTSISRSTEWLGKVAGVTQDAPTVQVTIGGESAKVRTEVLTAMPSQLLEMLARVVEKHPEHAPVLPLLEAEIRASFGVGEVVEQEPKQLE